MMSMRPGRISVTLLRSGDLIRLRDRKEGVSFSINGVCLNHIGGLVPKLGTYFMSINCRGSTFLRCLSLNPRFGSLRGFMGRALDSGGGLGSVSGTALLPSLSGSNAMTGALGMKRRMIIRVMGRPVSAGKPELASRLSFTKECLMLVPFGSGISISRGVGSDRRHTHLGRLLVDVGPGGFNIVIHAMTRKGHITRLSKRLGMLVGR